MFAPSSSSTAQKTIPRRRLPPGSLSTCGETNSPASGIEPARQITASDDAQRNPTAIRRPTCLGKWSSRNGPAAPMLARAPSGQSTLEEEERRRCSHEAAAVGRIGWPAERLRAPRASTRATSQSWGCARSPRQAQNAAGPERPARRWPVSRNVRHPPPSTGAPG